MNARLDYSWTLQIRDSLSNIGCKISMMVKMLVKCATSKITISMLFATFKLSWNFTNRSSIWNWLTSREYQTWIGSIREIVQWWTPRAYNLQQMINHPNPLGILIKVPGHPIRGWIFWLKCIVNRPIGIKPW